MLLCPHCNSRLGITIIISNMFGELNYKLEDNSIESCVSTLIPNNISISSENFYCFSCRREIDKDSIVTQCSYSGVIDLVSNFVLFAITKTSTNSIVEKKIIHKSKLDEYKRTSYIMKAYGHKEGFNVKTTSLKISETKIRND